MADRPNYRVPPDRGDIMRGRSRRFGGLVAVLIGALPLLLCGGVWLLLGMGSFRMAWLSVATLLALIAALVLALTFVAQGRVWSERALAWRAAVVLLAVALLVVRTLAR